MTDIVIHFANAGRLGAKASKIYKLAQTIKNAIGSTANLSADANKAGVRYRGFALRVNNLLEREPEKAAEDAIEVMLKHVFGKVRYTLVEGFPINVDPTCIDKKAIHLTFVHTPH